ncbi:MAG: iron-siderophore ABC transporter substrate-binding protein [Phormidesmis sp. RL_2_1]|nr:iron-siderophore ABC transporter substrate-binding protein [Phormidesmis sp. RL_2_1]
MLSILTRNRWCCWLGLLIGMAVLVVGCHRSSPSSDLSATSQDCRLVQHEKGTTEICGQPQSVAALSPHILDSILALGVQPAAYAESKNLNLKIFDQPKEQIPYIGKWVTTQPIALGDRKSPSLECLAQLKPDLILGEDWLTGDSYALLSQIAPTLLFTDTQADGTQAWQKDIPEIAKALDKEDKAEQLLASFPQQIETARSALQSVIAAYPRILLISSDLTSYTSIAPDSTTGRLLQEIGFDVVRIEGVESEAEISFEALPQLKADIIIVLSWDEALLFDPEDEVKAKWDKNPLLSSMPAAKADRVYFVDYQLWGSNIRGPLTDRLILEALPDLLLSSVRGN